MKTLKPSITAILPLLFVTGITPAITSTDEPLLEITVSDDYTGRPLQSARVTIYSFGDEIGSGETDAQGRVMFAMPTGSEEPELIPSALSLSRNYPNPFQTETRVDIGVPEEQAITATLYNILGQRIASQQLPVSAGYHTLSMSLGHLTTGVYILRVDGRESKTVTLFKMGRGVYTSAPVFSIAPGSAPGHDPDGRPDPVPVRVRNSDGTDGSVAAGSTEQSGLTASGRYSIRVQLARYDVFTGPLRIPASGRVSVPLSRNNQVELVTVDGQNNPVPRELEISFDGYHMPIVTPLVLSLKSGVYLVTEVEGEEARLEHQIEIVSVDTTLFLNFEADGVTLAGETGASARDATHDLDIRIRYPDQAYSKDPGLMDDGKVLRTEIELFVDPSATVGQVNQLLNAYDAQIVSMIEGTTLYVVRVPDPGDIPSLNQLIAAMRNDPIVFAANKSVVVEGPEPLFMDHNLPGRSDKNDAGVVGPGDGQPGEKRQKSGQFRQISGDIRQSSGEIQQIPGHIIPMSRIAHHLAARAHAAWNIRSAITELQNRPYVVIADFFGDGVPGAGYDAQFRPVDFSTNKTSSHGYHVLGIISGKYDRVETLDVGANNVTGIFPERLNVRAVDLADNTLNTWPRKMNQIILQIRSILAADANARIVLNTSLNSRSLNSQEDMAFGWIVRVRGVDFERPGSGLENRFIHFTSTGNNRITGVDTLRWHARENSMFAHAALEDRNVFGIEVPKLTNTFVVENRVNTPHQDAEDVRQRPMPGCASDRSIMGGTLSAMGTGVWSFGDCLQVSANACLVHGSDPHASRMSGTSMATPQAAGLAAFVWSVNPNLSAGQVMDIIIRTALVESTTSTPGFDCNEVAPQPVIDAYAAVLAAGMDNARLALLDVTGNGVFDHHDLEIIIDSLLLRDGRLDYSRFDLNGDGFTGGDGTGRFDLDMNGQYSEIRKAIDGESVSFDERHLTDMDILCYHAWSGLYSGGDTERRDLLFGLCKEPDTDVLVDIDGNVYPIVHIGDQWWMAENLRVTRYRNGDPIPNVTGAEEWQELSTGAWAYYDNDSAHNTPYGKLYNWFAVSDSRGLCPVGWEPASGDPASPFSWSRLSVALGGREVAGEKMKSTYGWVGNGNGTNESGWNGFPGGLRTADGSFSAMGYYGYWWTSTESFLDPQNTAWYLRLYYFNRDLFHSNGGKNAGLSVRCVRQ